MADFAYETRLLCSYFAGRGVPMSACADLAQDVWVRYYSALARGTLKPGGLGPLHKMAMYVLTDWRGRASQCEEATGDFENEAGLIQLQPEGGYRPPKRPYTYRQRAKGSTRPVELQRQIRAEAAAGVSARMLAAKYRVPRTAVQRILANREAA